MTVSSQMQAQEEEAPCKKHQILEQTILGFSEEDKERRIQPHDDALVVTLRIAGFNVKRVMVDQGSRAEIIYPDLFKGLGLRLEDLNKCDVPLVGFDGNTNIPKGMIWLPVQTGDEVVSVDFFMVDTFSRYTAILARPWLHAMGAVSSTLHVKLKYPTSEGVAELVGCQVVARQCMVVAISHRVSKVSSSEIEPTLYQPQPKLPVSLNCPVSCKELEKVIIREDVERYFQVGTQLPLKDKR